MIFVFIAVVVLAVVALLFPVLPVHGITPGVLPPIARCTKVLHLGGGGNEVCGEGPEAEIHRGIGPGNYPHKFTTA